MKQAFAVVIFIHGLFHALGFVKGFGFREVKELTLHISKPMALLWLVAGVLFLFYGAFYLASNRLAWLIGFIAVIISQVLIILFWKDARFGTLPNIAILIVLIVSFAQYSFTKVVEHETASLLLNKMKSPGTWIISEDDISKLPTPVQKWLVSTGVVGRPVIKVGRVIQQAKMKMKPDQNKWFKATAVQYTTVEVPSFIWAVNVRVNNFLSFRGRDKFEDGQGEMLIKLNSLIKIVDEKGEKLSEGSLQRFLGEMVWFPSLALSPYISWREVNNTTAIATMEYKGTKGEGIFYFDSAGDFIKYSAWRYMKNEPDAKRYEWVLLVEEYRMFEGIKVPSKMTATWKLEQEDWTWLELEIADIKYNENACYGDYVYNKQRVKAESSLDY